jgi:hypothetical protein
MICTFAVPFNLLPVLDSVPKLTLGVIRVHSTDPRCFIGRKLLLAVFSEEMIFDVDELPILVNPLEGMTAISVVVSPSVWCP